MANCLCSEDNAETVTISRASILTECNFNHSGSGMKSHCCRMCTDFLYTFDYVEQILESTGDQQGPTKRNQISNVELGSVAVVAFGSRAHLEKQALATVSSKSSVNVSIRRYIICPSNQP